MPLAEIQTGTNDPFGLGQHPLPLTVVKETYRGINFVFDDFLSSEIIILFSNKYVYKLGPLPPHFYMMYIVHHF